MLDLKAARSPLCPCVESALIAGLDLKPKVKEGAVLRNGFAVEVDTHICVGGDRSDETFAAQSAHN
jgi:hypothetical protein